VQADEGLGITIDRGAHPRSSIRGPAVKIRSVRINARRQAFEIRTSARRLLIPFAKVDPKPTPANPAVRAYVDKEIGSEGFGYVLRSGREGTVHIEQVLEYNKDPDHLRDQLISLLQILDCDVQLVVRSKTA
jgi:hypothetical protein